MSESPRRPISPSEMDSLRDAAPVDAELLQRIRAALTARESENDEDSGNAE
ncbi:hypothetical protein [Streptacidiphilus fuscans]|uniref:Uncharacterized protein n=1 Tax=Streptacidiphilus fuscans TaxID=2789292 RepID=A0A931B3E4_9ACTN|nr:hypothetical protein [Streptacidiphilus fuscans]MBF9069568.1 hypothetical protein [Streptacidiphilus fuscans]